MNLKVLLALILTLTTSAFAGEIQLEIPTAVKKLHALICPQSLNDEGNQLYNTVNVISEDLKIFIMGCEMYAYNSLEHAYLVSKDYQGNEVVALVSVADFIPGVGMVATTDLMGAGYDEKTKTLGTFQKGRGAGDCGSSATYKFDNRVEKFVLVLARNKLKCDGKPTQWPIVYKK